MTTMAQQLIREHNAFDALNAQAAYHSDVDIADSTRTKYAKQHARDIEVLYSKYGVQKQVVRTFPNGIKECLLVCSDGSVVGTVHDTFAYRVKAYSYLTGPHADPVSNQRYTRRSETSIVLHTDGLDEAVREAQELQQQGVRAYVERTSDGAEYASGVWV